MIKEIDDILHEIGTSTFEDLCFIFEDMDIDDDQFQVTNGKASIVEFTGAFSGKMIVKLTDTLMKETVCNMLGEDDPTENQMIDALGELSNVICGNALPEISGSKKNVFDLTSPKIVDFDELSSTEKIDAEVKIPTEDGLAILQFIKYD